ncbi:MAG TPA: hypothetical protein VK983_00115 [Candidatus Limnocylindrales bacterium]|nr:hypothetical protein [Candidatus Limnocylindrales bacterium]
MTSWWVVVLIIALGILAAILIYVTVENTILHKHHAKGKGGAKDIAGSVDKQIDQIFNDEFREELRNRGRLHFEKIIGENAMFLQQDLRLTTSQLNEYMKSEITRKLKEEFTKYEESIMDAKQLAVDSIEKTNTAIDEQRTILGEQLTKQVAEEKAHLINRFETDMATVINHYVLAAIGTQIDLSNQLGFIISELEAHKKEIIKDIANG